MPNALNLTGIALTTDQGRWKRLATRLAKEVLAPNAEKTDREAIFPMANLRRLGQEGLLALPLPKEMGGKGETILTTAIVTEELAAGCASTAMCFHMHMSTIPLIAALIEGDEQKEKLLGPIVRGEAFGSFAMSEPGS